MNAGDLLELLVDTDSPVGLAAPSLGLVLVAALLRLRAAKDAVVRRVLQRLAAKAIPLAHRSYTIELARASLRALAPDVTAADGRAHA